MVKNPNAKAEALAKLREFPNKKIDMTLNQLAMVFDGQNNEWKSKKNILKILSKNKIKIK